MAANIAAVDPLPFEPATSTAVEARGGAPPPARRRGGGGASRACGGRTARGRPARGVAGGRALAALKGGAVWAFVLGRSEGTRPTARLEYTAGGIYSVALPEGEAARLVWQVRGPRADTIVLRLDARDRAASI